MRVPGIEGYDQAISRFVRSTEALDFHSVCKDFVPFLPKPPARILDVGSGIGQNAAALSDLKYAVFAVEPMDTFREYARSKYIHSGVTWLDDSLPTLAKLDVPFDFIIVEAVWHHLSPTEQEQAFIRLTHLLTPGGKLALSLRNGPAGLGSTVYSTDAPSMVRTAEQLGLMCALRLENLPSVLPNKPDVTWARLVFKQVNTVRL